MGAGLQLGKQLDLWKDVILLFITEVVDSDLGFSLTQILQGKLRAS